VTQATPLSGKLIRAPARLSQDESNIPNLRSLAEVVLKICLIVCQKFEGSRDLGHAPFRGNYSCARSDFPRGSFVPNLKSLAHLVLKICSIVCQKFEGSRDLGHAPLGEYFA